MGHIYKMFLDRVGYYAVGSGMSFIREHVLLNISLVSRRFERSKLFFFYSMRNFVVIVRKFLQVYVVLLKILFLYLFVLNF